jgi:UDP-N-acetylmuramate: L-alanyl-gamma-D-glutamyl-meso-diaminopimelate ligase
MAPLAVLLDRAGHRVTGSDRAFFPPMSEVLAGTGIRVFEGFAPENLASRPDLVIVGNAVPKTNEEAREAERLGLERMSFPQAVEEFFLAGKRTLVVAGTHGKTTTTGMLARALQVAGLEPGYLVGGLVRDLGEFARAAAGDYFVIEGDEYDSAYFDKEPKFLHYQPSAAIVTSVEFDHADIYRDLAHVQAAFTRLARLLPAGAPLVGHGDCENLHAAIRDAGAFRLVTYGVGADNDWRAVALQRTEHGTIFEARYRGHREATLELALSGEVNALNALAVYALCVDLGVDRGAVAEALRSYRGAARRQELLGEQRGIAVVDDFAHHPTAVAATLAALRQRHPERRLVAVFEPRSNTSRRAIFQEQYAEALAAADRVVVSEVYSKDNDPLGPEERLSTDRLIADLRTAGRQAWTAAGPDAILDRLVGELEAGDIVVCMSNGAFGNLPRRLLDALG